MTWRTALLVIVALLVLAVGVWLLFFRLGTTNRGVPLPVNTAPGYLAHEFVDQEIPAQRHVFLTA